MPKATTDRALAWLRKDGWTAESGERWIPTPNKPRPGFHKDLFGGIDVVAVRPGSLGVLGVQTTGFKHRWNRREKLLELPVMRVWVMGGNSLWVVAWRPKGHELAATPNVYKITLEDWSKA